MKEVRSPKKPLLYYYCIVLLVIVLFNLIMAPLLSRSQVDEVDYNVFMDMIDEKNIGAVQVEGFPDLFTDKSGDTVYKTGPMEDPTLTERLHEAGAQFTRVISEPVSPVWNFLLTFVLPLLIFIGLGQYMNRRLMKQMGGKGFLKLRHGKEQRQGLRPVHKGNPVLRRGPVRTRRRKAGRGGGLPA